MSKQRAMGASISTLRSPVIMLRSLCLLLCSAG
jgi:hypothetical protein